MTVMLYQFIRFIYSIFFTILIIISSLFIIKSLEKKNIEKKSPKSFIINEFQDLHYDKIDNRGLILYSAAFKSTIHYKNKNILFHDIAIIFYNQKKIEKNWYITSNYAKKINKENIVNFYDKVIIDNLREGRVFTDKVLYDDPNSRLSSSNLVAMTKLSTNFIITGIGFLSYPKQGSFFLISNVRSYFYAKK